jgi:dipeptidyl aminopeptidase/acylaminoacyl peptidase
MSGLRSRGKAHLAIWAVLVLILFSLALSGNELPAKEKRPLTAKDEIELAHFGDPYSGHPEAVFFSPDRRYFVVMTERGELSRNRVESTLRVYTSEAVRAHLRDKGNGPITWVLTWSTYREGPIVTRIRWLRDSHSFAFLLKTASGRNQLMVADVDRKSVVPLTLAIQHVTAFDIRDRRHFVYTVWSKEGPTDEGAPAVIGTGRPLDELLFPRDSALPPQMYLRSELWAVVDGKRFEIHDSSSRKVVQLYFPGQQALALSPDGRLLLTARPVEVIPETWGHSYPPPEPSSIYRIRAGRQDLSSVSGFGYVNEYVLIDLVRGSVGSVTNAPTGEAAGWYGFAGAAWSEDGQRVALTNTFVETNGNAFAGQPNIPCVAVLDLRDRRGVCLDREQRANNERYIAEGVEFLPGSTPRLRIKLYRDTTLTLDTYVEENAGSWTLQREQTGQSRMTLNVTVQQRFDSPPLLVATDETRGVSRVIWNPNPQLHEIKLSDVDGFRWKDRTGRDWVGALYKPTDYQPGHAYPLVIQTHGFHEDQFEPSGVFPTGFAAQQLASAGFVVLQMRDCAGRVTPEEGSCNVDGYESAVETLTEMGLVDPDKIGITGFSRTCFYVMEALTSGRIHFKAASITDGVNVGYLQYLTQVDRFSNAIAREGNAMIGASPFGTGLQEWIEKSPEFNMDKVQAPLQIVATRGAGLLFMWEPYAALRYLNKPVDLVVLNSAEHVLTNPKARLISQGGAVDWFRFWIKNEEDQDPTKAAQYGRWRSLRQLTAIN